MGRSKKEIEKDCIKIKEAARGVKSLKELSEVTGLSYAKIRTTLSSHPIIERRVKEQISKNKENLKLEEVKTPSQTSNSTEIDVLSTQTDSNPTEVDVLSTQTDSNPTEAKITSYTYVMDTSMCSIENFRDIINRLILERKKINLTSVVVKELQKTKLYRDACAANAKFIFSVAARFEDSFIYSKIAEDAETPDKCIINYCIKHRDSVILLSADNEMTVDARLHGVVVRHFEHQSCNLSDNDLSFRNYRNASKIVTLHSVYKDNGDLKFSINNDRHHRYCLLSSGTKYTYGEHKLNIGDIVYVATDKIDQAGNRYLTFAAYQIISAYLEKNARLIASYRVYNDEEIDKLENSDYIEFFSDFHNQLTLN